MKKLRLLAHFPFAASAGAYVIVALSDFLTGDWWYGALFLGVAVIFAWWNVLFRKMAWTIYRQGASDLLSGQMSQNRDELWVRVKRAFKGDPLLIVEPPKPATDATHEPTTADYPQLSGQREAAEDRRYPQDSPAVRPPQPPFPVQQPPLGHWQ